MKVPSSSGRILVINLEPKETAALSDGWGAEGGGGGVKLLQEPVLTFGGCLRQSSLVLGRLEKEHLEPA